MSIEFLIALAGFIFTTSITPGPNNMMLMASGVNFGFRRTIPHLAGVNVGFMLMVGLVGLGLGAVFKEIPALYTILKYAGAAYMLWLAWRIANAGPAEEGEARGQPMSFLQAVAFQWINPKAWVMAIGGISAYTFADAYFTSLAVLMLLDGVIGVPCSIAWVVFGVGMRKLLQDPKRVRVFNVTMALLLVASLWPIVAELWPQ